MDHTEATIGQYYYWPNLKGKFWTQINVCKNYQKNKKQNKNMFIYPQRGQIPPPRTDLSVQSIDSYKIRRQGQDDPIIIKALTMIYPVTGWFKTVQYNKKKEDKIAKQVEQ